MSSMTNTYKKRTLSLHNKLIFIYTIHKLYLCNIKIIKYYYIIEN